MRNRFTIALLLLVVINYNYAQKTASITWNLSSVDSQKISLTVGDIEGQPFLEAIRQMRYKYGPENTLFIHLTLLPYLAGSKELKTKPTQASVRELRSMGIHPDIVMPRADYPVKKEHLKKIALFCDVEENCVIPALTMDTIYEVPLNLQQYKITQLIAKKLKLKTIMVQKKYLDKMEKTVIKLNF